MKNNSKLCSIFTAICIVCAMVCVAALVIAILDGRAKFESIFTYGISFPLGGFFSSFIISGLFYWKGIIPEIRSINNVSLNKIAFNIAKQFMSVIGTNHEECIKQSYKNEIESKAVSAIFPKAELCVEKYHQQFNSLSAKYQNKTGTGVTWSTFASFDSIIDDKCIDAKKFKALQSKFKKEIVELVLIDLFIDKS